MFLVHLGYFGPLVMGVLDSSFLVLPFGNDLLLVWLVAAKHHGAVWYVLAAATGSTLGAWLLALVARKLGKEGICKYAGEKQFNRLQKYVGHRAAVAIAVGALAPPPFPYTIVIAIASALDQSLPEILLTNFLARAARFTVLAWLAMKYGNGILQVVQSAPFRYTMYVFIFLCLGLSVLSVVKWARNARSAKQQPVGARA